jgi:hypothetical protein
MTTDDTSARASAGASAGAFSAVRQEAFALSLSDFFSLIGSTCGLGLVAVLVAVLVVVVVGPGQLRGRDQVAVLVRVAAATRILSVVVVSQHPPQEAKQPLSLPLLRPVLCPCHCHGRCQCHSAAVQGDANEKGRETRQTRRRQLMP